MSPRSILVIVQITTSKRDIAGNCCHFAHFYDPRKPRFHGSMGLLVDGESNARDIAFRLAGQDWERVLVFNTVLPKSEWKKALNIAETYKEGWAGYHGAEYAINSLCGHFNVPTSTIARKY